MLLGESWDMKVNPQVSYLHEDIQNTPERNGKEDFDADGYSSGLLGTILSRHMCDKGLLQALRRECYSK